jgi:two-component system, sensor histidine kinase and response regulator
MPHRQHGSGSFWMRFPALRRLAAAIADRGRPASVDFAAAGDATAPAMPAPSANPPAPLRVLVVEDDKVNQLVVAGMLRQLAHHADCVADGIEALQALHERAYDVVLMDIRMPNMDGIEAARRIRRMEGAAARIPIIALTANATTEERLRCEAAGMDDFMSKPFRRAELEGRLTAWRSRSGGAPDDESATGAAGRL